MEIPALLHHLVFRAAKFNPDAGALVYGQQSLSYSEIAHAVTGFSAGLLSIGLMRGERVAVFLEQRPEAVIAAFGTCAAGGVHVPVNPLLKAAQVAHILKNCGVKLLVTSAVRLALLTQVLPDCPALRNIVVVDAPPRSSFAFSCVLHQWDAFLSASPLPMHRVIDADVAVIFYTSGSTGQPKGVMVSHRNLICGALSVAGYLQNRPTDVLLAALPLSFDAGFSQLTTGFLSGAKVVLLNYLMPMDLLKVIQDQQVTGLTAVPPLFQQLSRLNWPANIADSLRYFASTGGRMPRETLAAIRARAPNALPYLMYGLTEAFRSTYLPPDEVDRRPDSIGRAIPGAEILVLRPDGFPCSPNEPGELVHRGSLVTLGYWNDTERTAERFRALPAAAFGEREGHCLPEIAVFSGDTVRQDEDGFLYFVGRNDDMIKTSGYRLSPNEVEDLVYSTALVSECAAFGIGDENLGEVICLVALPAGEENISARTLLAACRTCMPRYMVPSRVIWAKRALPRNPNGKVDRATLRVQLEKMPGQDSPENDQFLIDD